MMRPVTAKPARTCKLTHFVCYSCYLRREKKDELPRMQVAFIDTICLPIYDAFAKLYPDVLKPLYEGVVSNRGNWIALAHEQSKLRDWAAGESGKKIVRQ